MPKCEDCGKKFDVNEARSAYDSDDQWAGDLTYDEGFPEHSICGSCAIADTVENLGAGRAYQFSLETGHPPEDVPEDWSPSND